jgi:hypothetical protein
MGSSGHVNINSPGKHAASMEDDALFLLVTPMAVMSGSADLV